MTGTLYVVPTPIGNLEDITLRAIRVLGEVDLVAAEDTRRTRSLLTHFAIRTKLTSYHQHNKRAVIGRIMKALLSGDVALVSDAGMPSICDPGYELVAAAIDEGVQVEVLPGPSAVTTAVALAALPARGFVFLGFPSRSRSDLEKQLDPLKPLPYALVLFEAPSRVRATLVAIRSVLGDRGMVAVRELSKLHEEAIRGTISEVIAVCDGRHPRGEWTLVIGAAADITPVEFTDMDVSSKLDVLRRMGAPARDAVGIVADQCHRPRTEVYALWLRLADPNQRS